ncbi:MAG: ABC transporter ATP-binding protein [Desulfosarcinaceae bacterium]|nr:ABC transporter ATP-binding protein [Desulfosarcinaceae bacterium]
MDRLELQGVAKRFGDLWVVDGVDLTLAEGEIVALLGPSGCGKTSLLRLIAGLSRPDRGRIRFGGRDLAAVPPHRRGFRMMFQEFALFPHRNVARNVAYGLEIEKRPPEAVQRRVGEMLALVGLSGYEERDVEALSGGERQRVALARSLAAEPRLLMLDEPLAALDRTLRQRLLLDLVQILRRIRVTTLFVTHDQKEAFGVADRIAVMQSGRILQIDAPEALYRRPRSAAVARFLGFSNLIPGEATASDSVRTPLGEFPVDGPHSAAPGPVILLVRPEAATIAPSHLPTPSVRVAGRVTASLFQGDTYRVAVLTQSGVSLSVILAARPTPPAVGESIHLELDPRAAVLLPAEDPL